MPVTDSRVDAYIEKSADFARPVLEHLRKLIHKACPEVQETIKWGMPAFEHKGPLCSMAAFKGHCAFGFWKTALLPDPEGVLTHRSDSVGSLGRIEKTADLPSDKALLALLKAAKKLNDEGIKLQPKKKNSVRRELVMPDPLKEAFKKNKKALQTFESFSYSHKKEYLAWITEAKTEATQNKRIATTIEWMTTEKKEQLELQ
ncbi:DUF1801 domain-containing protein [Sediminibacterium ginsengisoli]|uniref:YdhG-like domain-containing protein n=1 Tax=Sediminibacterium ginsengisoli TaxID=413434 RepID=A0A1T4M3B3_9BACT|nr:DUF1801 domain-containing protein [Sediminibacterium ginsengisoli]SJZ61366.1 hypothetical protein SAMN04488132_103139 [Sediminibacterium ginsengisoli]